MDMNALNTENSPEYSFSIRLTYSSRYAAAGGMRSSGVPQRMSQQTASDGTFQILLFSLEKRPIHSCFSVSNAYTSWFTWVSMFSLDR